MNKWRLIVVLFVMTIFSSSVLHAAVKPHAFYLNPFAGGYAFEKDEFRKNSPVYGLGFGYNFSSHWSAELVGTYSEVPNELVSQTEYNLITGRLDILYHLWPDQGFVPHLAIGGGMMSEDDPSNDLGSSDEDAIVHYGFGLKFYLSENVALRFDARHIFNLNDSDVGDSQAKSNFAYTGGFLFQFGGEDPVKLPADSDNDGVIDPFDRCPGTRLGIEVDGFGCPVDKDGDGVPDYRDACPETPSCTPVDRDGCPSLAEESASAPGTDSMAVVDGDGDGVADGPDKCPNTPPGVPVNEYGCPSDSDGDGVFDFEDGCPGTLPGEPVDASGCPIPVEESTLDLDVEFLPNGTSVPAGARDQLENAARFIKAHPESHIVIEGHTDSVGPADFNLKLSQKRAENVRKYLVENFDIAPEKIEAKGFGESAPIADNATQAGRKMNRRVVVTTVSE